MRSLDLGDDWDDRDWGLFQMKGILGGVIVRDSDSGTEYLVEFYTPYTLNEAVEDELTRRAGAVVPTNSIVVEDITPQHLQRAIDTIELGELVPRDRA
jgi:hypothetical protein